MFFIPDLLNQEQLAQVRAWAAEVSFVDGRQTAGAGSDYQKHNLQADQRDAAAQQAQALIHEVLLKHPKFRILAQPHEVRPFMLNCYAEGMYYRDHMDHALLSGKSLIRGDLSATVFLTDPADYDGGELVINSDSPENQATVKLPAGHAVVYSAATMHRVNPVTRGKRLGAVTTVQSRVADPTRRQLLGEVAQLTRWVQDTAPRTTQERMANKIYVNLLRLWSET